MQAFEKSGLWWLPSKPENVIAGKLLFTEDRNFLLQLMGTLTDPADVFGFSGIVAIPLILGVTEDNKEVTLQHCVQKGSRLNSTGFTSQDFRVRIAYMGSHFTEIEALTFDSVLLEYSHLFDWSQISGFSRTPIRRETEPRTYILSYTEPEEIIFDIPGGTIRLTSSANVSRHTSTESITQSTRIGITLEQRLSFGEWLRLYISPLQDFLSLATCKPNAVTRVLFQIDGEAEEGEPTRKLNIETFFEPVFYETEDARKQNDPQLLFTLQDLENVGATFNRWLQIRDELRTVSNLFFGSQYGPARYIDSRFLIAAQAVEMYHRERFPNTLRPEAEHREMVRTIVCSVPKEHRRWLQEQLAFSNEPRLLQRVSELLELSWDVLKPLLRDKDQFARKVKDTRNYYTHYNPRLAAKAARGADLHWINEALYFLLQRCYLHELGFSSDKSVALFMRNQRYLNALANAKFSWLKKEE